MPETEGQNGLGNGLAGANFDTTNSGEFLLEGLFPDLFILA